MNSSYRLTGSAGILAGILALWHTPARMPALPVSCGKLGCGLLALLLGLCLQSAVFGQDDPQLLLPALVSDNMVLQKHWVNVISGKCLPPRQYVTITYNNRTYGPERARSDGTWEIELDLREVEQVDPAELVIRVAKGKKEPGTVFPLRNVVVGQVWLVGTLGPKGVAADPTGAKAMVKGIPAVATCVRFLTLTNLDQGVPEAATGWQPCAPQAPEFQNLSALSFHWAFQFLNKNPYAPQYIGIIQARTNELVRLLGSATWTQDLKRNRLDLYTETHDLCASVLAGANQEVQAVQQANRRSLIAAKHGGWVTNLPAVFPYDAPDVRLREAFKDTLSAHLNFEGAVW